MNGWTTVRAPCRLHLGLFNVGDATPFRYGGAGFAVEEPHVEVSIRGARSNVVHLAAEVDRKAMSDLRVVLSALEARFGRRHAVTVRRLPPQHSGLGTKTALVLAVLRAAFAIRGVSAGREELQRLSRRGGASGVGIHTFFDGGYVIDAGRRANAGEPYAPSSAHQDNQHSIPLALMQGPMPRTWRVGLFVTSGARIAGKRERDFFAQNAPIPRSEAFRALGIGLQHLGVALKVGDVGELSAALNALHGVGFKRREVEMQSAPTQRLLAELQGMPDCAAGLSSMGPLVYAICPGGRDGERSMASAVALAHRLGAEALAVTACRNRGYEFVP